MPAVFHLQIARRRRWDLIGALFFTFASVAYFVATYQGAVRLPSALFMGALAIYQWFRWSKLLHAPDATIELDDTGIKFSPPDYWQVDRIDWKELTDVKVEFTSIWLMYRKDGEEKTRDIPRKDLLPEDYTKIPEVIRQKLSELSQA